MDFLKGHLHTSLSYTPVDTTSSLGQRAPSPHVRERSLHTPWILRSPAIQITRITEALPQNPLGSQQLPTSLSLVMMFQGPTGTQTSQTRVLALLPICRCTKFDAHKRTSTVRSKILQLEGSEKLYEGWGVCTSMTVPQDSSRNCPEQISAS